VALAFKTVRWIRRVASPAGVVKMHPEPGKAKQRVVLDDLAVGPRGRDAIAQEDYGVSVTQGEFSQRGVIRDRSEHQASEQHRQNLSSSSQNRRHDKSPLAIDPDARKRNDFPTQTVPTILTLYEYRGVPAASNPLADPTRPERLQELLRVTSCK
jgi:hypothetical protein